MLLLLPLLLRQLVVLVMFIVVMVSAVFLELRQKTPLRHGDHWSLSYWANLFITTSCKELPSAFIFDAAAIAIEVIADTPATLL